MERTLEHKDYLENNKRIIKSMGSGRLPRQRIDVPEDVDIYMYG